ncbi:hypothetical protein [Streptomyces sp. NPDC054784]
MQRAPPRVHVDVLPGGSYGPPRSGPGRRRALSGAGADRRAGARI